MTVFWILLAILYVMGLFFIALWGDKEGPQAKKLTRHPLVYSLSLAIYCTAWTFYGSVGEATRSGWNYLPILLGPILLYLFAFPLLRKMITVSHKQNITSIADFISCRYGKRPITAPLVILICMLAVIPYIALQLKAIGSNFALFVHQEESSSTLIVLIASILMGVFAMLFGTRKVEVTEYRSGMMLAIGAESLFKLIAIIAVGLVVWIMTQDLNFATLEERVDVSVWHPDAFLSFPFLMQTFMAAAAVICLPRQFHVTVVDHQDKRQSNMARWMFPLYLAIFALIIPPISLAGQGLFSSSINPDTYVIQFALVSDNLPLQILIFLGGISATTAMTIVATFVLSIMISNDVILPIMLARASAQQQALPLYRRRILVIRRLAMMGILTLSFLYYQKMANHESLSGTGVLAFSLVLQLMPAVFGGLYWKRGHAYGVYTGLTFGFISWILLMMLPLSGSIEWGLDSEQSRSEVISYGAFISLLANIFGYVVGSLLSTERLIDRIQATAFVSPTTELEKGFFKPKSKATNSDFFVLLSTFLGKQKSQQVLDNFERDYNQSMTPSDSPNRLFVDYCERILGGVLGGSSARTIINSILIDKQIKVEEMVTYLDETTQAIQFSQNLLFVSMDNLDQGISVVDKELRIVAWNKTYLRLYPYPEGMLKVGLPVEQLIRFNAQRGECGVGEIEDLVNKRLDHLKKGTTHRFLRRRANGRVIEMVGNPLPDGGFVTSFTDITEHIESQQALKEANIDLEKRVEARTEEVQSVNHELLQEINRRNKAEKALMDAKGEAEQANASKTEFLALASHDILQPLNAAKLYMGILNSTELEDDTGHVIRKLSDSLESTEALISTLLEIARLDQGAIQPTLETCNLDNILRPIIAEFDVIAASKKIQFSTHLRSFNVYSDPIYLRRIIQNFVSNAVKYTPKGRVLLSVRPRKHQVLLQVWDTGVGIPDAEQDKVFDDFYRWENTQEPGMGLGLGLVRRMQKQLGLVTQVHSIPGKGSCFSIQIPMATNQTTPLPKTKIEPDEKTQDHSNCRVWCIDDDANNLAAMASLLAHWQCECRSFQNYEHAFAAEGEAELLLVDYHLDGDKDGLNLIQALREKAGHCIPAALLTASREPDLIETCKAQQISYMAKPAKPAKLRALIRHVQKS
ncbi:PAS domain-containing hybrid sensor histidine kinase/response regulator [Marinomonas posidonica]|uniref:histidine kinase n=1 Tax=Marinomonas posidonica (strain CECT 7376 / NCIMB 14433 / IVIA-Po-181) TaxID=491952 RepID=F6CW88_MARPP|nr:PAS domain-containing hybrid sensor histidine kinase/response regulator [Marinomonas posidonica]AEF55449.1 integral membrane sensor hybrid histidine kinase [Marinomonas posidonica IVIA-Po-181]